MLTIRFIELYIPVCHYWSSKVWSRQCVRDRECLDPAPVQQWVYLMWYKCYILCERTTCPKWHKYAADMCGGCGGNISSFDDHDFFSCLNSSPLAILCFFLCEPLSSVSVYPSLFIHLLYVFCRQFLWLRFPQGYKCTVNFSKHIHPMTYHWVWTELVSMAVYYTLWRWKVSSSKIWMFCTHQVSARYNFVAAYDWY